MQRPAEKVLSYPSDIRTKIRFMIVLYMRNMLEIELFINYLHTTVIRNIDVKIRGSHEESLGHMKFFMYVKV